MTRIPWLLVNLKKKSLQFFDTQYPKFRALKASCMNITGLNQNFEKTIFCSHWFDQLYNLKRYKRKLHEINTHLELSHWFFCWFRLLCSLHSNCRCHYHLQWNLICNKKFWKSDAFGLHELSTYILLWSPLLLCYINVRFENLFSPLAIL